MAKGLCRKCYLESYRNDPKNSERIRDRKRKWYQENVTPTYTKERREQRHFSGKRDRVLTRDGWRCTECGEDKLSKLIVHHKNDKGRGTDAPDNRMSNLVTLCRGCHARHHHTLKRWSREHDACTECSTTERRHNARGLCWKCYQAWLDEETLKMI